MTYRRKMSWAVLAVLLVTWALVPAVVDVVVLGASGGAEFPTTAEAVDLVAGKAVGVAVVVAAISALRWWPDVLREGLRTRRWVWAIPAAFLVASIATVDYTRLASAGAGLTVALLGGTLLLAVSEELMFRGVVLTFLRDRYPEIGAAVGSSVLFGISHVLAGPLQIVMSILFGYLLYLCRRVSGGLLVPIAVHAAWDFSVFSGLTTMTPATDSSTGLILALVTFAGCVAALVGRRRLSPSRAGRDV